MTRRTITISGIHPMSTSRTVKQEVQDGIPPRYDIAVGIEHAKTIKDLQLKKDELPELKMNLGPLPDSYAPKV